MRFGFCSGSYTSRSTAVADEECINLFPESVESQGTVAPAKAYGGATAQGQKALFWTPGEKLFTALPDSPTRGSIEILGRTFAVGGSKFCEVNADKTNTVLGAISNDGLPASLAATNIQVAIVAAGGLWCFDLATNTLTEVTGKLVGVPLQVGATDSYFIVTLKGTNKFQVSSPLDGTTWPGLQVSAIEVFPENIRSLIVNHREPQIFGYRNMQPFQDTGTDEVFDPIQGAMQEFGSAATFGPAKLDNSVFWIGEDERGSIMAWRQGQGYSQQRVSTHAVEYDLGTYSKAQIAGIVSYAYQDGGHAFWVVYIPGAKWTWVYDVAESLWHKRQSNGGPHWSWNYVYAFGKHLVGDWNTGNLYELSLAYYDDNETAITRVRRPPTIKDELKRIPHRELRIEFAMGQGPQPALTDTEGNPRAPQAMLRMSDDGGLTWGNEHWRDCGKAGQFGLFARWLRLGMPRRRVYELTMTDPVPWVIVEAYLNPED
jgi:hypothetical protein